MQITIRLLSIKIIHLIVHSLNIRLNLQISQSMRSKKKKKHLTGKNTRLLIEKASNENTDKNSQDSTSRYLYNIIVILYDLRFKYALNCNGRRANKIIIIILSSYPSVLGTKM